MIFKSIVLENFRPYYGKVKLEFCNGEQNITLLKAENGSGKTTLLEAIRWALYGGLLNLNSSDPKDFGASSFINKKYIQENKNEKIEASVTLNIFGRSSLNNEEKNYKIKRTVSFVKDKYIETKLEIEAEGEKELKDADRDYLQSKINRLLPQEINFFIDGERLEKIAPEEKAKSNSKRESLKNIQESINRVLGIKSLENAVFDVGKVYNALEKDYIEKSKVEGHLDDILKKFNEKSSDIKKLQVQREEKISELRIIIDEREELEIEISEIPKKIRDKENKKNRVQNLQNQIKNLKKNKNHIEEKYKSFLSVNGVELISKNILQSSYNVLENKKVKGEIPSTYEKEFLEELLELKVCICGASLEEYTQNCETILKKLANADKKEDKQKIIEMFLIVKNSTEKKVIEKLKLFKSEIEKIKNEIDVFQNEIDEIVNNSEDFDLIKQYEEKCLIRNKKNEEEKEIHIEINTIDNRIENLKDEFNSIQKEKIAAENKNKKFKKEKIKRDFSKQILENLKILKQYKEEQGREGLKLKIEEVYSKINKKGYKVQLTENFEFKIFDIDGREVGMSKGESKNKALSFIGGLVYYAKELNEQRDKNNLDTNGGIYPLVLDAPYGDLDNEYRIEFTKILPILSEQIIVMVSSGQWNEEIESVISNRIGKIYRLENQRRVGLDKNYDITKIEEEKKW